MSSEAQSVAFDASPALPSMASISAHPDWLGFPGDSFSTFGAPFPGGYSFDSKTFSAFPPLQAQQAIPVNVSRAEVDSTGDSKGPPTPASAASANSQCDDAHIDGSPGANAPPGGYRPWEQNAESFTDEKSSSAVSAAGKAAPTAIVSSARGSAASAPNEPFHNGPTPSEDSTSSTQASADQRPPSVYKAPSQTPSPFGNGDAAPGGGGNGASFRPTATAEADTTTTELRPVVPDFQTSTIVSTQQSTPLSRPPSQMQVVVPPTTVAHSLAALEPLQPVQPVLPLQQLQVPMQGQCWSRELASPQAVPVSVPISMTAMQLGRIPGQHLLLHPQQHSPPVQSLNQPGQTIALRQLSTPPTPSQMVPASSSPGLAEVSGSLERRQQKKKRKRCGECRGCLKRDNCGECGPCRSVRSHQICRARRCDSLVGTKKDKTPAQPRQKKTDGTKAKGTAKNARANGQDGSVGMTGVPVVAIKRHRSTPDENKNLHQLSSDIKSQFGLLGAPPNAMYIHDPSTMPTSHMAGYATGVPTTTTFAPNGQALFNDPDQYVVAHPPYGHTPHPMGGPGVAPPPPPGHPMSLASFQPPPHQQQQQADEFNQQRHQLTNSRLKTLIQQRASQKDGEPNSQDGFRPPAGQHTPTTPTSSSPPEFYASVSRPGWAASNGQQQQSLAKLETAGPGRDASSGQTAGAPSPASERPPSNQSVGRQTPQSYGPGPQQQQQQGAFGSPKTAFQSPANSTSAAATVLNGFPAHSPRSQFDADQNSGKGELRPSAATVVSSGQFLLSSTASVSYPSVVTYTGPPPPGSAAYDPRTTVGFAPKASFYQGGQFGALPPAAEGVMGASLYGTATNGFATTGPLPSMGSGFGVSALPPIHSTGPQATSLNLPGTDPWWERLERIKAHDQQQTTAAAPNDSRVEYSSAGQSM